MKKPYRTLTVNEIDYNWIVSTNSIGTFLRIYRAEDKQIIYSQQIANHRLPIKPKLVSDIVYDIEYGCVGGNHDLVPILGFENSHDGEQCRQCGIQYNNAGEIINRKDEKNV